MLAVLFAALAPTVSHALAASTTGMLAEMCSVDGPAKKAPSNTMHGMEHCPYCATHGGSPALPPHSLTGFAVIGGHCGEDQHSRPDRADDVAADDDRRFAHALDQRAHDEALACRATRITF